jgi:hypothetical protein
VDRIVYLGGITPAERPLSDHLASRDDVARILLDSGVPTVVLRAAIILGSGSASFEMLRYLTERLPVMVTPRWVHNRVQPIAVRDVLHYLTHAATLPSELSRGFDIGGPDVLTYLDMMRRYAVVAGLPRRLVAPVPVLTPWLSAQWVNLVTPVPRSIAVPLIDSLVHEVVCHDHDVADHIPDPEGGLTHYERAIELALTRVRNADVPTRWSDASISARPPTCYPLTPTGRAARCMRMSGKPAPGPTRRPCGRSSSRSAASTAGTPSPLAWSVRGWIDRLAGGAGLRRGRRDPRRLHTGEALDWWRVEHVDRPQLLRLRAEMRLPGRAWLELSALPGPGGARYRQRAIFEPQGLAGHLYWQSIAPFHGLIFGGMARNITGAAEHQRGAADDSRGEAEKT